MSDKDDAITNLLLNVASAQEMLSDVLSSVIAELAMLAPKPDVRLEQIISSEEGAVFSAISATDLSKPSAKKIQAAKEEHRERLFRKARENVAHLKRRSS